MSSVVGLRRMAIGPLVLVARAGGVANRSRRDGAWALLVGAANHPFVAP